MITNCQLLKKLCLPKTTQTNGVIMYGEIVKNVLHQALKPYWNDMVHCLQHIIAAQVQCMAMIML